MFAKDGFAGYTVHAVVAASEISLGSLYHHFGSMDGLSSALYSRCMASLLDHIGDALDERPQSSARQVITTIPRAYLEWTAKEKVASAFIHAAPAERFLPLHAEQVLKDKAPRLERIVRAIRPWVKKREITPIPEPLMEMLIIGPVAEVARRMVFGVPNLTLEDAIRVLPERVWCAVRQR